MPKGMTFLNSNEMVDTAASISRQASWSLQARRRIIGISRTYGALSGAYTANQKELNMNDLMNADARREACDEMQFQYGDDHHFWDYAQWVAEMLLQSLEHIEGLVGAEMAAVPLRQLVQPVADQGHPNAKTWRDVVDDVFAAGTVWPISDQLQHALLYGVFGVTPKTIPMKERSVWVSNLVEEVCSFASRSDVKALGEEGNAIVRVANIASSRYALDTVRGEVDIVSMSILGSVSEGRVRNLMSGSDGHLERGTDGGIIAMSALSWLQKRKGFMESIWKEEEVEPEDCKRPQEAIKAEKTLFVPVARDGSIFNPDLVRGDKFQVGAKGEERHFDTFSEALAALNSMPTPRWRRPNENGHWGIVSGTAWQRIAQQK